MSMIPKPFSLTIASVAALLAVMATGAPTAYPAPIKNIVLVHGAWVDGSGWKPVYELLVKDGYRVSVLNV